MVKFYSIFPCWFLFPFLVPEMPKPSKKWFFCWNGIENLIPHSKAVRFFSSFCVIGAKKAYNYTKSNNFTLIVNQPNPLNIASKASILFNFDLLWFFSGNLGHNFFQKLNFCIKTYKTWYLSAKVVNLHEKSIILCKNIIFMIPL